MEEVIRTLENAETYFWATYSGAELDLLVIKGLEKIGYEFKYSSAPKLTKSMHTSMEDLGLTKLYVVYPGDKEYALSEDILVTPLANVV